MADYRSVKVEMWAQDEWFMDLPTDAKLLWLYLFTNAHASVAGIYKLPAKTIAFETGIDLERVQSLLDVFAQHGKAKHADGIVWVVKMREHQATRSPKVEARIKSDLAALQDTPLKREYLRKYSTDTVSIGYPELRSETETETETETERKRDARPPSPAPIDLIQNGEDPEWHAALAKLDTQWLGSVTGSVQLKLARIWPQMSNGKRTWLDDAIAEAVARNARTPDYAITVLANALRDNKRPGETPQPAHRSKGGVTKAEMDAIFGVDIHGNPV
jgi:hypothetical protein